MRRVMMLCACILFVVVPVLFAQSAQPQLVLNTEMHPGRINRISVDSGERFILTCSNDKTAKLWLAQTGELVRTFRVPIGPGNEGMLFSCALSPDGLTAAVGGWDKLNDNSIFFFDTRTGFLKKRIGNIINVINDLEYSPDGNYVAAALGGANGVRVFNARTYELTASLEGYEGNCYGIAFDGGGRLATTCYDSYIRLYDSDFRLLASKKLPDEARPFGVAFSPDGANIAVGMGGKRLVQIFDGSTLRLLHEPDLSDVSESEDITKVCFSHDGRFLVGTGSHSKFRNLYWWRQIRVWPNVGMGTPTDYNAGGNAIMDLRSLSDNSIVYCGSLPDIGRISLDGKRFFYKSPEINDFAARDKSHFKTNYAGDEVGFTPHTKSPAGFSIKNRDLMQGSRDLPSPVDSLPGLKVSDWETSTAPVINGREVDFLSRYERTCSVDINPGNGLIVFGADWNIYCVDEGGSTIWKTPSLEAVWAVNISGNGNVVAAALGSGLIKWYRMSDGAELLALFPHPDGRWVLWTPSGYYDASPGGEGLIGWHINNGRDAAPDFYSIYRFRSTYYRPDIVSKVLETYDEGEAIRLANEELGRQKQMVSIKSVLPPVVNITSPMSGDAVSSTEVTLRYTVRSSGGEPITNVRVLVNGRPAQGQRGMKPVGSTSGETVTVTIPPQDCDVSLIAENANGLSEPAIVRLKWRGKSTDEFVAKPKLYVLAVGISNYHDESLRLGLAAKDAADIAGILKKQGSVLYRDVNVKVLTNAQATKGEILDGLDWIQRETTSRDVAVIFLAGHGVNDPTGLFYFLPVDVNTDKLKRTGIPFSEIVNTVSSIAGKVLVFADACHSGNIMGTRRGAADITSVVNELASTENGAVTFTSSTGKQFSLEDESWGNGAFTKALVEGIAGKADFNRTGKITVKMLDLYVAERVKELTKGRQSPTTVIPPNVPDFPIIMVPR